MECICYKNESTRPILECISNSPMDKCNAVGKKNQNEQNSMASDVNSIICDICGKQFKSICHLRDHHFMCMKDKQIEYAECNETFPNKDVFKIHMCKHLCLNECPGELHPNLISETNVHLNEKSDSVVSENHVEAVKIEGHGSVVTQNVLLSENVSNRKELLKRNIVESVMEGIGFQNANVTDSSNAEKPISDISPEIDPSVSELVNDMVQDICDKKFKWLSNPDTCHFIHSSDKQYCFLESDKTFNENLNGHIEIYKRKQDIHNGESRIILKQKNIIHNIIESAMRNHIQNTKVQSLFYNNDEKSVDNGLPVTKPSVSEFTCDICDQKFTCKSNFNTHLLTHTNYKCTECDKQFSRFDHLRRHVKIHSKKPDERERYKCKICLKSFKYQTRLNVHLRIHINAREFKCTLCGKGFNQKCTLVSHMLTHSDDKPHECSICNKKFAMKNSLTRHLQRHSGDKPHQCDVCFYRFSFFGELKEHYRKHTGELPFECNICQKRFRRRCGLNAHIAAHTGNQPHKCDICQKKFFLKSTLLSHKRIHTQDKMFACDICDKSFRTKNRLKLHCQVHTGEKPFVCSYCNKTFAHRGGHDRHILIHTGTKPYECEICNRFFNQKTSLQRHQVVHTKEKPYSCDICEKSFTQKSYLSTHKLTHSKKKS